MKIKEYNEMIKYLTKPKATKEEAAATWDRLESEFNEERKQGMKQLEKVAAQPDSRGVYKQFVKDSEKEDAESKALMQSVIRSSPTPIPGYVGGATPGPKEKPYYMNNPVNGKLENVNAKGFDWDKQKNIQNMY